MKYLRLFEDFDSYDPYELMIIPPNKKAEMIVGEINKGGPNLNLVSDLIVLGANLDWRDEDNGNWTPLHWAANRGRVEIARMLIDAGADLNVQNEWEQTPLHRAAIYGRVEIVRMLLDAGARKDIRDEEGSTPLHLAAMFGEIEIVQMLIDAGAIKDISNIAGRLPYDLAKTKELKKLLKPNLSESFDSYDPYELMIIPPNKKAEMIIEEIKKSKSNLNLVSDLIVLGANVDWQDEDNWNYTPLHWAAMYGRVEIAGMLIGAKANLNLQDEDGDTPLHWAASHWNVEIAEMLIDAGARKDILDYRGRLPYDLARYEEMKNLLRP